MNHVLITGGASGIGAATAQLLADAGSRVSVLDRSGPETAEWWNELPAERRGHWATVDASDATALAKATDEIAADGLTGLVACAGISIKEPFLDSSDDAWAKTMAVNVIGTATACRSAARAMVAAGNGGAIVTVASTVGFGYVAGLGSHYHASKGAIIALTRAMAGELGQHGIRVNAVAPGLVRTPLTEFMRETQGEDVLTLRVPLRAMADPVDVAEAIAFLLSADASMITGHILPIDAGQLSVAGQPLSGFADPTTPRATLSYS
ncbi:SDR family oxidoreductase [Mycetocola sp. 2940]|uniref:SDR family NAD(P)-dependent oxidoreductase n=1 Tax=Mycetocola sp. 2940 TaxID=3156452 RepID=UPI00339A9E16